MTVSPGALEAPQCHVEDVYVKSDFEHRRRPSSIMLWDPENDNRAAAGVSCRRCTTGCIEKRRIRVAPVFGFKAQPAFIGVHRDPPVGQVSGDYRSTSDGTLRI